MPHEEQIEWPSFETVLRDVAPDSPAARSLASADQRAQYSATAEAIRASEEPVDDDLDIIESPTDEVELSVDPMSSTIDVASSSLPEPLAPLDLDTSSIRALLEPREAVEVDSPIAEDALSELAPLPELDLGTPIEVESVAEIDNDVLDVAAADGLEADSPADDTQLSEIVDSSDDEEIPEFEEIPELEEVTELDDIDLEPAFAADEFSSDMSIEFEPFEPLAVDREEPAPTEAFSALDDDSLVFELAEDEIQQVDDAHELEIPEPLADPFSNEDFFDATVIDDATGVDELDADSGVDDEADADIDTHVDYANLIVDVDDLQVDRLEAVDLPESVTSVPGIELPNQDTGSVEVFDDLAPMNLTGLVPPEPQTAEPPADTFDSASSDLFDLNDDSDSIEQDRIALHGEDLYEASDFDSIAAADEIETDLDQLIDFSEEPDQDNVIPLRPDIEVPTSPAAEAQSPVAPEGPLLTGGTGWVALDPEPVRQAPDPWADMRPTEEPKKGGFWANRPKFFGGDERRKRKSERREAEAEPIQQAVDVTFDKECPRCGAECQVDLDDPIGRRVHVSCPSCENIWYTPYILEDSQAG